MLKFTRADDIRLPEGFRVRFSDGMLVKKPAPTGWHQVIIGRLHLLLAAVVGSRRVVMAPIDLFVDDVNVIKPDVAVMSETTPLGPGSDEIPVPLPVAEVLSPSTARRDRREKPPLYFRSGVREVWIVDPEHRSLEIPTSAGPRPLPPGEPPRSEIVPGFAVDTAALFAE